MSSLHRLHFHINPVAAFGGFLLLTMFGCVPATPGSQLTPASASVSTSTATEITTGSVDTLEDGIETDDESSVADAPKPPVAPSTPAVTQPQPAPAVTQPAPAPQAPTPVAKPEIKSKPEAPKVSKNIPESEYRMPQFNPSWGLSQAIYEKVVAYYGKNLRDFKNPRFVTIVDFSKPSSQKRFFVFDLAKEKMTKLLTSHGKNSDRKGLAAFFSNREETQKSSLGFYRTQAPYQGAHGYSLKLEGLEASNSNALARGIVIHSGSYVSEAEGRAGLSWGCLVLDPKFHRSVIDHLKGGSLLYVGK